jgi:hypothetical protein
MIAVPAGVRVLIATKPADFRRGADSLAALAAEERPFTTATTMPSPRRSAAFTRPRSSTAEALSAQLKLLSSPRWNG